MSKVMTTPVRFEANGQEVSLTGNTVANYLTRGNSDVSEQEIVMFMNLCKFQKLNPFLNEAYLIKFGSQDAQIVVSKEAFMKRAESHPQYAGQQAGIIVQRGEELVEIEGAVKLPTDTLIGGWATIFRKDREQPTVAKISLEEFGKKQATWNQMPNNMIRKSAIVNALREAFPEHIGAMYSEDEVQTEPRNIQAEVEQDIKVNANKEVLDFEEPEVLFNQKGDVITEFDEVPMTEKEVQEEQDEQSALFDNLGDLPPTDPGF